MKRPTYLGWLFALACVVSSSGAHAGYSSLFIEGDSLSDSGNNAVVLAPNVTSVPISGNAFVPTCPYASGHYTNGQVWAQTVASALGLSANPSLLGGTDYAFGGATTGPLSSSLFSPFPPSLETQAAVFLAQHGNVAPSDALYVVAGGGNDARDALPAIAAAIATTCTNPLTFLVCANGIMQPTADAFATDIKTIVGELESAGAENIVVWDTPDVGKAPAVVASGGAALSAIASLLASTMNSALLAGIGLDSDVKLFDIYGLVDKVVGSPGAFGLTNATDACAQFLNCDPSQ